MTNEALSEPVIELILLTLLFCGMALHHDMLPHSYLYFDSMTALESGARSGVCECCCESCSLQ